MSTIIDLIFLGFLGFLEWYSGEVLSSSDLILEGGSGGIGVWIMNADGSDQRVLIRNTLSRATWQPAVPGN